MDRFRSKITQNYPKTHCSVTFIDIAGEVVLGEEGEEVIGAHVQRISGRIVVLGCDEASLTEDEGAAVVLGDGDDAEVGDRPVADVAVEVVDLPALGAGTDPRERHDLVSIVVPATILEMRITMPDRTAIAGLAAIILLRGQS